MFRRFVDYFSDKGDNDPSYIHLTQGILVFSILATIASMWFVSVDLNTPGFLFVIAALLFSGVYEIVALVYVQRGNVLPAKIAIPLVLTIAVTIIAVIHNSLHDITIISFPLIIVIGNLLQGRRSLWVTTPFVVVALILLGVADRQGLTSTPISARIGVDITIGVLLILACAQMLHLLVDRLQSAVFKAEANEKAQIEAVGQLNILRESFDSDVARRTAEIEAANQRNEKRARQFEAIAQVSRAIATSQNLDALLLTLTEVISQQFDFYHTGIFLIDENREYAILRAANSQGGRRMLAREHKLGLGQSGIVGYVSASGKARIALDVGADAAFFNNPDLPNTHSEMALPLRVTDQVIGVLDIQSTMPNAFSNDDIEVLSTLADQVTIAIQNARSYEITRTLLIKAQQSSASFLRDSWRVLQSQSQNIGYQLSNQKMQSMSKPITSEYAQKAVSSRQTIKEDGESAVLAIPIRFHGEVVGVVDIRVPNDHKWDEDEIDIAEAVADRLSLALESALLLKATQRRAEIERITADISSRIGASSQFDAILRTAAEELSRALGGSEVLVQLNRDTFEAL